MSNRPSIPKATQQLLLYESAFACVVCQERAGHIHHMDEDNTNNDPSNLVPLCLKHHDEAHTKHQLSQNLTVSRLKDFKSKWFRAVLTRRQQSIDLSLQRERAGPFLSLGVTWGYINHRRVVQILTPAMLEEVDQRLRARCESMGMIDHRGIILPTDREFSPSNYVLGTVYDRFDHLAGNALHMLYGEFVDKIARAAQPIHITDQNWTKTFVKNVLRPNDFIFFRRGQYFKKVEESNENAHIRVRTFRGKLEVNYSVDTRDMFGTTSITCSFSGRQTCSSLLQIKSINEDAGKILLACTPIALGVGFQEPSFETENV